MSVLQYPDAFDAPDLQVWNNAAFDHGESEPLTWASSNPDCVNLTLSLESDDCSKENRSPSGPVGNSQVRLLNLNLNLPLEPGSASPSPVLKGIKWKDPQEEKVQSGRDIDAEIEEIEREISRLSTRLEVLRIEKAEQNPKTTEPPRGRVVPAKFMEQKQGNRSSQEEKKIDGAPLSSTKPKINRRGVSLGPGEIASAVKTRPSNKPEVTPVMSVQSRRKSCFWKLQEIDELKVTKERRKSLSLTVSPKTQKTVSKTQPQKQAVTTVGSKRATKKEEGVISAIQPKRLFKEGEKSAKKPAKLGRVVPSRYNQITISAARKRSFPENDKEEADRSDKRRASQGTTVEGKAKKRWEIPREVVLYKSDEAEEDKKKANKSSSETPLSAVRINEVLPKIRIARGFVNESPRDSGPAKRAAELVGRRNYFVQGEEDTGQTQFCQALSFLGDVEEE
ncbi:uncharacterized protein LOC116202354 [Punica granatum]|uniref:Uncharacterized protein n=2 Tax=Punica granatum TaxID=22663 RepID=A0A2I0JBC3_PUNGR|nr:uncharacterized protein LOC116202354 [Punica granatum]PKI52946.1 hypothetical protein CRG98_026652 [Punica granatum]